ncbi:VOC family protein [Scleromatobacter humisilvae]|uniref:VOC family protein n=1 Tax=Scleromatobacter humisilvae TaxID=2897159 RepID=A0A9X1YR70_9BURK|nr:VOC family protein [Scleromatobacter humisilvae]MCK9686931.1 VOC family protein [Scleromatobacter humisilvae]
MSAAHFVWYELMTADAPAAIDFYKQVVGWSAQDSGMPGGIYTLMMVGDAQVAGVMQTPDELKAIGAPSAWSGYLAVDDVDAMAARVLAAGGKVLRPAEDIPGIGRFAVVADPQNAAFMLFKPLRSDPPPMPPAGAPGTTGWHELRAMDGAAVFDFYATLFGWTKGEGLPMGPLGTYQLFEIDGVPSGAIMTKEPDAPTPGWRYYFHVDAIDAAAARVAQRGGQVTMGPMQVPGGSWVLHGLDPQGAVFALMSMTK